MDIQAHANGADTGAHLVQVGLVNAQEEPATNKDVVWLFQSKLILTVAVEQELAVFTYLRIVAVGEASARACAGR